MVFTPHQYCGEASSRPKCAAEEGTNLRSELRGDGPDLDCGLLDVLASFGDRVDALIGRQRRHWGEDFVGTVDLVYGEPATSFPNHPLTTN